MGKDKDFYAKHPLIGGQYGQSNHLMVFRRSYRDYYPA